MRAISDKTKRQDIHEAGVPVLCRSCEARHRGICGALTPEQLLLLSKHTSRHLYESESGMLTVGDEIHRYANILNGVVKLTKLMRDGRQQIVGLQFAPDFMGRPFASHNDVTVEAATDVRICSFPRRVLEDIIAESPEVEHRLYQQNLKELSEAREWMLTLGRKTANEKVASFLHMIALNIDPETNAEQESVTFELPLKRADIADFLGLTIETVSRQITKLRKAGVIELVENRRVHVPNINRLAYAAEPD